MTNFYVKFSITKKCNYNIYMYPISNAVCRSIKIIWLKFLPSALAIPVLTEALCIRLMKCLCSGFTRMANRIPHRVHTSTSSISTSTNARTKTCEYYSPGKVKVKIKMSLTFTGSSSFDISKSQTLSEFTISWNILHSTKIWLVSQNAGVCLSLYKNVWSQNP